MKSIVILLLGFMLVGNAHGQNGTDKKGQQPKDTLNRKTVPMVGDGKYCGFIDHNVIKVRYNGEELKDDVILKDGTKVGKDGMVVLKDGSWQVLREGDCVDKSGLLIKNPKDN